MKKILLILFFSTSLLTFFSCRENNPNAQTPEDANPTEGVRESGEDAMEKARERAGTDTSKIQTDSMR